MKTHLANAAYDLPHNGSYPTVSVLGSLPIARALYGAPVFSPYLPLVSRQHAEITGRHYVSYVAIHYEVSGGSQS
jgi:hypothetical protein